MRISDWSSDVCSSDLPVAALKDMAADPMAAVESLGIAAVELAHAAGECRLPRLHHQMVAVRQQAIAKAAPVEARAAFAQNLEEQQGVLRAAEHRLAAKSEEHTPELQSLMRHSYPV